MLMSPYLQAFYESLPDLVAIIPSILYKESKEEAEAEKRKGEKEEKNRKEADVDDFEEDLQPDEEEVEEVNLEEDEDLQEAINLSNRMVFDAFLGITCRTFLFSFLNRTWYRYGICPYLKKN